MKVKNYLKQVRLRKKLSQSLVAQKSGIATSSYIEIENGTATPNIRTAFLIAKALNQRIDKLFYLSIYEKY